MKRNKIAQVRVLLERNPRMKTADVMKALGTTKSYTYVLMSKARSSYQKQYGETIEERMIRLRELAKKLNNDPARVTQSVEELKAQIKPLGVTLIEADPVNNPAHYTSGGIETIDFIEAKKLGYNLGNVVKYITRSGLKGNHLEDLRKAQWYLTREINSLK
jgi:succinate dehydrogenase/fumarate reductase flavoprotein subunit